MSRQYTLDNLLYLMARLRAPKDGCPWDKKQSFESIVPHTIEEAYEVAEAIDKGDMAHITDELGDLLFQVIFYAQLGKEQGSFDFQSVVDAIVTKLLRRHPHVFPDGSLESRLPPGQSITEAEIKANWEKIKAEERAEKAGGDGSTPVFESRLKAISNALPPLIVAEKLQHKAASVGFDWKTIGPVFDKLDEELDELKEVALGSAADREANRLAIEHELGDVLFCCVNLARFLSVKPDHALRQANQRFRDRFGYIEHALADQNRSPLDATLDEMESLWQEAKKAKR